MGLLNKLWDDTLAGPRPDSGLGKLRNNGTGSTNFATTNASVSEVEEGRANREFQQSNVEARQVTQRITIIKPRPGYHRSLSMDSSSSSPAGSSPPLSPASLTPRERDNPWRRNNNVPEIQTVYEGSVFDSVMDLI